MPVTKTAKRALRGSIKKHAINQTMEMRLETAIRKVKKTKSAESVRTASSLADRAAKKKIIHKNKAARIKSSLSKLLVKTPAKKAAPKKKSPKAKKTK